MARRVVLVAALCVLIFLRGWHSMAQKSATFDEWGHLENGIAFLARDPDGFPLPLTTLINPPLARMLAAAGIEHRGWEPARHPSPPPARCRAERKWRERLGAFPFRYDVDSRAVLARGRLPILLFSLLGIPLLMALAAEAGYPRAGPWAALVYSLCPNMLANARLITPDAPVMVLYLATALGWLRLAHRPNLVRALCAGAILGAALGTKYSVGLILPALGLIPAVAPRGLRLRALAWGVAAGCVGLCILIGLYAWVAVPFVNRASVAAAEHQEEIARFLPHLDTWIGRHVVMPVALYRYGAVVAGRAVMKSFLVGHHRLGGWPSYFPIAMAVKTPLCLLLALSLAAGWAWRRRAWTRSTVWLAGLPAVYLAITVAKGIQVGLRHVLPVYPFMALAAGLFLASWWSAGGRRRTVAGVLALGMAAEGLAIHPHYLAFFNLGAGGPDRGHRYLVDCNLDWGQDLPALASLQRREGLGPVMLSYFGTDLPERYGIAYTFMCTPVLRGPPSPGVYAISATAYQGLYEYPARVGGLSWFREHEPTWIIAHSILVYDLRR